MRLTAGEVDAANEDFKEMRREGKKDSGVLRWQRGCADRFSVVAKGQPASEPFESRDIELGSVLGAWVHANTGRWQIELKGPLEAIGMDPTWILNLRSHGLEADVYLFYGPVLDVSAFRPEDVHEGAFIGGAQDFTADRLLEMLDELGEAADGRALPGWLRSVPL